MVDTVRKGRSLALGAAIAVVVGLLGAVVVRLATHHDPIARFTTPGAVAGNEPGIVVTPADGTTLPDTALLAFDGTTTTARALGGRPLVINFWSSTCVPCVTEMPTFEKVHTSLGDKVAFAGVAFDGVDSAKAFATKTGVTYPLWLDPDGATQRALKVSVLPTTVFVSADGVVRRTTFGALDESKLRSTITEVFGSAVGA